jgi:hypothetical protein
VESKAANLNLPLYGRYGRRAAEGNRLHPSWIYRLSKKTTEEFSMAKRFFSPLNTFILLALPLVVSLLSAITSFSAETNSVPQTTQVTLAWDANDPKSDGATLFFKEQKAKIIITANLMVLLPIILPRSTI